MSPTMFLGRVVLPAIGLIVAAGVTWHSFRQVTARTEIIRVGEPAGSAARATGRIIAEGRVVAYPGAQVTVGTEVLGTIINMPARETVAVRKGDLLVELRSDDIKASLREAHFRLIETETGVRLLRARYQLDRIFPALECENTAGRRQSARRTCGRPGSPRRRQGRRRPSGGRVGQVPNHGADRWCGHCPLRRTR